MGNSVANTVLQTLSSERHRKNPTMRQCFLWEWHLIIGWGILYKLSLAIYHQNIRSIKGKEGELILFLNDKCNKPDIVCMSEQ